MRKPLTTLFLITIGFYSCGQIHQSPSNQANNDSNKEDAIKLDDGFIKIIDFSRDNYAHTEADYRDSSGKGIIIQNSYPRGGGLLHISNKIQYGHAVFWSRVINKTDKPLELTVHFPADSFLISPSPHVHFKLLVPPDTMTLNKVSTFSFGLENVGTFVHKNFHQPSQLHRTINPNEDAMFYIILLSRLATPDKGVSRTGLFLKDQNLVYKLNVSPSISKLLPCGRIVFKD